MINTTYTQKVVLGLSLFSVYVSAFGATTYLADSARTVAFYKFSFLTYDNPILLVVVPSLVAAYTFCTEFGKDKTELVVCAITTLGAVAVMGFLWLTAFFKVDGSFLSLLLSFFALLPVALLHIALFFGMPIAILVTLPSFLRGLHFLLSPRGAKALEAHQHKKRIHFFKTKISEHYKVAKDASRQVDQELDKMGKNDIIKTSPHSMSKNERGGEKRSHDTNSHVPAAYSSRFLTFLDVRGETKLRSAYRDLFEVSRDAVAAQSELEENKDDLDYARLERSVITEEMKRKTIQQKHAYEAAKRRLEYEQVQRSLRGIRSDIEEKEERTRREAELKELREKQKKENKPKSRDEYMQALKDLDLWRTKTKRMLIQERNEELTKIKLNEERTDINKRYNELLSEVDEYTQEEMRALKSSIHS